jgi:hypothetical protein
MGSGVSGTTEVSFCPVRYESIMYIWTPIAASESAMTKQQKITNPINRLTSFCTDEVITFPTR